MITIATAANGNSNIAASAMIWDLSLPWEVSVGFY